jgi:hypothetical protein
MSHPEINRRAFLRRASVATAAALLTPTGLASDPYRPVHGFRPAARPVRIRGRVTVDGGGRRGVAVSDGRTVAASGRDGSYELVSDGYRPFVFASVPAGATIPTSSVGTARFFHPIPPDGSDRMQADFAFRSLGLSDERHAFLALGDTQTQNLFETGRLHAESVPDMQRTIAGLGGYPLFGIAVGDIMFDDLSLYPEYERAVERLGIPFLQVVGNHDLDFDSPTDPGTTRTFRSHFGPTCYSFDRGQVHYVVLDDVFWHGAGYIGHLDADQLAWLAEDLALVEPGRTVVVFQHIPALSTEYRRAGQARPGASVSVTNREALYRLLEPFEAHVISGHTHEHEHVFEGSVHEHVLGTVCGAWWSDDICHDGTPNGYAVFEVAGSDLRWRYEATGRPAEDRLRVYARGSVPGAPDEIVANVWDWDPRTTVTWTEDGVRRGAMARRTARDPWAVERFTGPDRPERRSWVEPGLVDHLFFAPVAAGARSVVVEWTDRFGARWTASPPAP